MMNEKLIDLRFEADEVEGDVAECELCNDSLLVSNLVLIDRPEGGDLALCADCLDRETEGYVDEDRDSLDEEKEIDNE